MNSSSAIKAYSLILCCAASLIACAPEPMPTPQILSETRISDRITVNTTHMGGVRVIESSVYRTNGKAHADITIAIDPNQAPAHSAACSTWFTEMNEVAPQATDFTQNGSFQGFTSKTLTWTAPTPYGHRVVIDFTAVD